MPPTLAALALKLSLPWLALRKTVDPEKEGSEALLQSRCVAWLRQKHPLVGMMCSIAGARLKGGNTTWKKLLFQGMSPGFPDLFIYYPACN